MIRQQINLYQDRFKEKRMWLSANQVATSLLVLVGVALIWSFLLYHQIEEGKRENLQIQANKQRMADELSAANVELAELLKDNRLEREIETMSRQVSARKKVLNFVDQNQFGSGQGFSRYLVALAQLQQDQIWLREIKFAEDFVHIKGSSLSAEQIPGYFDRFSSKTTFQGNRFDLFEINRASDSDWKVDFEIATSGAADEK